MIPTSIPATYTGGVFKIDAPLDLPEGSTVQLQIGVESARIVSTLSVRGGKPCIAGHRIAVQDIAIWHERMNQSVDEIVSDYDLGIADVYSALAYYYDHRAEIDESIRAGELYAEELRQKIPSKLGEKFRGKN